MSRSGTWSVRVQTVEKHRKHESCFYFEFQTVPHRLILEKFRRQIEFPLIGFHLSFINRLRRELLKRPPYRAVFKSYIKHSHCLLRSRVGKINFTLLFRLHGMAREYEEDAFKTSTTIEALFTRMFYWKIIKKLVRWMPGECFIEFIIVFVTIFLYFLIWLNIFPFNGASFIIYLNLIAALFTVCCRFNSFLLSQTRFFFWSPDSNEARDFLCRRRDLKD